MRLPTKLIEGGVSEEKRAVQVQSDPSAPENVTLEPPNNKLARSDVCNEEKTGSAYFPLL
jgi:hypothetical protein